MQIRVGLIMAPHLQCNNWHNNLVKELEDDDLNIVLACCYRSKVNVWDLFWKCFGAQFVDPLDPQEKRTHRTEIWRMLLIKTSWRSVFLKFCTQCCWTMLLTLTLYKSAIWICDMRDSKVNSPCMMKWARAWPKIKVEPNGPPNSKGGNIRAFLTTKLNTLGLCC